MPVRSLDSSVLRWPDDETVVAAVRAWAEDARGRRPGVRKIGYFGSYARGDWGVGSDLDVLVIVDRSDEPFERRALDFDATGLPVPTDVFVYTSEEWHRLTAELGFQRTAAREAVWVYRRGQG